MSLLTPLYIAGALAIALPILFHLIRRTPQGRQAFSSLMFLSPSPPRITRRSRLNNVLLLLLRALALLLLAFAFARPLLRQDADLNVSDQQGRRMALLVDTSASMQRGDLWPQALRQVEDVLNKTSPADEVALYTFDGTLRDRLSFSEWNSLEHSRRGPVLQARLAEHSPTWAATNLGDALAGVADALADSSDAESAAAARQVVLITDLQSGSRLESLQGYQWPEGVLLDAKLVAVKKSANAAITLVQDVSDEDVEQPRDGKLRVRASNEAPSTGEQFTLAWHNAQGPLKDLEPTKAYVPPGTSRVLRIAWPTGAAADRLVLAGDDHEFDNTLYLIPPRPEQVRVVYVGDEAADDTQGLRYFLEAAAGSNARRTVEFLARGSQASLLPADLLQTRLVVIGATISQSQTAMLKSYLEQGGMVLCVLRDAGMAEGVARLMGLESLAAEEAAAGDYALLGEIAFDHPLFAAFADPRFSDFTKLRFWKHRQVRLPDDFTGRVLARFDTGDPFLIEQTIGKGRLLVATSGWHAADSQLARSTKFVPLIGALIDRPRAGYEQAQHIAFEPIELPPAEAGPRRLVDPDGNAIELPATSTSFTAERPGIYRLLHEGRESQWAVNLEPDEARTAPLAVEELESRGARLGAQPTQTELAQRNRQLRLIELENRQKLWRWLIVAVLAVLILETALAGRLAHRAAATAT